MNHLLPFFPTLRSLRFLPIREPRGLAGFFSCVASSSALAPTFLPSEEAIRRFLGEGSSKDAFELLSLAPSCSRFLLLSVDPGIVAAYKKEQISRYLKIVP
jgi:hypothetical protein